jgi:hypothetical protein
MIYFIIVSEEKKETSHYGTEIRFFFLLFCKKEAPTYLIFERIDIIIYYFAIKKIIDAIVRE